MPDVFVKKADPEVLKDLDAKGNCYLMHRNSSMSIHTAGDVIHRLIYYARESWFIKMTAVKDDLIA